MGDLGSWTKDATPFLLVVLPPSVLQSRNMGQLCWMPACLRAGPNSLGIWGKALMLSGAYPQWYESIQQETFSHSELDKGLPSHLSPCHRGYTVCVPCPRHGEYPTPTTFSFLPPTCRINWICYHQQHSPGGLHDLFSGNENELL